MHVSSALLILATIIMAVLKVNGTLAVSWWLVTAPIWAPIALSLSWILMLFILAVVGCVVAALLER